MKTRFFIIIAIGSIVGLSTFFLVTYHDPNDELPDQELTYEQFFREYISTSCPIIEKPEGATSFDSENCKWIERDWYEGDQFEKIIRYCTDPESNTAGETSSINKGGEIKLDSKNCTWFHGGFYNQVWVNQTADPVPLIQNGNVMSPEGNVLRPVKENENSNRSSFTQIESLRPEDRLQVRHSAGYTTVEITLSSWKEYNKWEESIGTEHDPMPPIPINESNINPIVFDLLSEMWQFKDYEVSKYDKNLFVKTVQKDYGVPNHHGIQDWLKAEYDKAFGESNDGYSSHFEFRDKVYQITMVAAD